MVTETAARPQGYYLDEQTVTHIVAAHLDSKSDYEPEQVSATMIRVDEDSDVSGWMRENYVDDVVDELYPEWRPSTEARQESSVVITLSYAFQPNSAGCDRFNSVVQRTQSLLAQLLQDGSGSVAHSGRNPAITHLSTTTWAVYIDVTENVGFYGDKMFAGTGLRIGAIQQDVAGGSQNAVRLVIDSDGRYE